MQVRLPTTSPRSCFERIAKGTVSGADWEVEGPAWDPLSRGSLTRYTLRLETADVVLREIGGTQAGYLPYHLSVLKEGNVIGVRGEKDATRPVARLITAVSRMVEQHRTELRRQVLAGLEEG